ncbi:hypothetical protein KCG44_06120 [Pacificimonas sp. WHA3]|uniref:TPM domain-containing protein n=1 Tax=Pacificimonas pallii TaxID=2827236 RepID=A0ABS6SDC9_9SPHN|nr:hypothetical protein [Pacificimonas pallii]MBV7256360.1 hypothetical protein [Pacificimonas pallii]
MSFNRVAACGILMTLLTPAAVSAQQPSVPQAVIGEDAIGADPASPERRRTASERLFFSLQNNENGSEIDRLVAGMLTELNADCAAVESYQTFAKSSAFVSMKIKCADRALYAVTVGPQGLGVISGGDGSVERMLPEQGEIRMLNGEAPVQPRVRRGPPLITKQNLAILGGVFIIGVVLTGLFWRRRAKAIAPWRGLRSEDKDRLIEESDEVWADVFEHPSGIWLARGRRGKRRLFRNQLFAYLYARHAVKLFQVR